MTTDSKRVTEPRQSAARTQVRSLIRMLQRVEQHLSREPYRQYDEDGDPLAGLDRCEALCVSDAVRVAVASGTRPLLKTYDEQRDAFERAADAALRSRYERTRRLSTLAGGALSYLLLSNEISDALYAEARDNWEDDGEVTLTEYCSTCSLMYKCYTTDEGEPSKRGQCMVCAEDTNGVLADYDELHDALPRVE